jgi:hypothetical protein
MSDTPTFREGNDAHADDRTRREQPGTGAGEAPTHRERPGQTETPTRREGRTASVSGTKRLNLPASISEKYDYERDLREAGGEADLAVLRDRATGERVVFKTYRPGVVPDAMAMMMLRRADPAHVVRLIDFHDDTDGTWEIQEYCPLGSMRDWVAGKGGRLDEDTLRACVREIADALAYLHALGSGIAHRDLKPSNVLVRAEDPLDLVLADFGMAKAQQIMTHRATAVEGTFHYAAPEVHMMQSSARSDWFSLGAMVYEFSTGRKLFALADGQDVSEDDAKARCLDGDYPTDLIDDPRWRLLVDGLLVYDRTRRWGADEVAAWLRGESPEVYRAAPGEAVRVGQTVGYHPGWTPALVRTPADLAEQFRQHWDEAAGELAGRPDEKMLRFLRGFPGCDEAVAIVESNEDPGPKLVRLQGILDPDGVIEFEGTALDEASLGARIVAGDKGDEKALDWLAAVIDQHILTAYAEVTGSELAAQADYWLNKWNDQAVEAARPLPPDYKTLGEQAFRAALPELFTIALRRANDAAGAG